MVDNRALIKIFIAIKMSNKILCLTATTRSIYGVVLCLNTYEIFYKTLKLKSRKYDATTSQSYFQEMTIR